MSRNAISRLIINDVIKLLDSGTNIVLNKDKSNLLGQLSYRVRQQFKTKNKAQTSKRIVRYMKTHGLIEFKELSRGKLKLQITKSGLDRAQKIALDEITIPKLGRWDRKWRIVFFDIPEIHRQARNRLVLKLKDLGFYQLQRSIWVHPYPCTIEIEYIKRAYKLSGYVNLAEVSKIDAQNQLLHHFKKLVPQKRIS